MENEEENFSERSHMFRDYEKVPTIVGSEERQNQKNGKFYSEFFWLLNLDCINFKFF